MAEAPWTSAERRQQSIDDHAAEHTGEATYLLEIQNAYDAIMAGQLNVPVNIARRRGIIRNGTPQPGGGGNMIFLIEMNGATNRTIGLTNANTVFHYSKENR